MLMVIDVRPPALGESLHEERFVSATEKDDGPVAFRSSLPWPGDPLFDDPGAKVRFDLALFGPNDGLK